MVEQSLVFIKPDGVKRGILGQILTRFETRGIKIKELKLLNMTEALTDAHYQEHVTRSFYPSLKSYIMSGPIAVMVLEGPEGLVNVIRKMVGVTNAAEAESGTIRGDFALTLSENVIHASDSVESAKREISNFFS